MNVTEVSAEGLAREYKVVVAAADLKADLDNRVAELAPKVNLPGFRPGKVPAKVVLQRFGKSIVGEILQETLQSSTQKALEDQDVRPALQPKIDMDEGFEDIDGKTDLSFTLSVEIIPDVPDADFSSIKVEKPTVEVTDEMVDERIADIAKAQTNYADKEEGAAAEDGDQVVIDFLGKLDGEPFEGGEGKDTPLVLGSGRFIPGFEEQLVGAKAGDETVLNVTFPEEYGSEDLAGKDATFDVTVKAVQAPEDVEINDAFAESLGLKDLAELKERISSGINNDYASMSREKVKRALLDQLDDVFDFEVPAGLLDAEFHQIWHQFEHEMEHQNKNFDDMEKSEDEYREEYKEIAARRVRLGLALAELGRKNDIQVTEQELQQALMQQASQFPGQEQMVMKYYQENPEAIGQMRAPILEDKVVDFILEMATVEEKAVTVEELMAPADEGADDEKSDD